MSHFATFYSFKGGVGRTQALANVACLLAGHRREPCRVLLWDFDLYAPGLQQVFSCKWNGHRRGFADYVHNYLVKAELDDISNYIFHTDVAGVDILPAGGMDEHYARKLEQIRWGDIYQHYRGFHFIDMTKKLISQLAAPYDYVLVDSLTGYSDIGGICVRQIPDTVVLVFRLNDQNLTGIEEVYRSLQTAQGTRLTKPTVIPVISPSWPFASLEANAWILKARKIFQNEIQEISFEGSLTLGEQVISKHKDKYEISPRIIQEYQMLARTLRQLNPRDPITIYEEADVQLRRQRFADAGKKSLELLKIRPHNQRYWDLLLSSYLPAPKQDREKLVGEGFLEWIDIQCGAQNPQALVARARLAGHVGNARLALANLSQALEIDPKYPQAYRQRAFLYFNRHDFAEAAKDYSQLLQLPGRDYADIHKYRGICHFYLGRIDDALSDFDSTLGLEQANAVALTWKAKVYYSLARYEDARAIIERARELHPSNEHIRILGIHILAMLNAEEAKREIRILQERATDISSRLNLAEAILTVDAHGALEFLNSFKPKHPFKAIVLILKTVCAELLVRPTLVTELLSQLDRIKKKPEWSFVELRQFLVWGVEQGRVEAHSAQVIGELISRFDTNLPSTNAAVAAE